MEEAYVQMRGSIHSFQVKATNNHELPHYCYFYFLFILLFVDDRNKKAQPIESTVR